MFWLNPKDLYIYSTTLYSCCNSTCLHGTTIYTTSILTIENPIHCSFMATFKQQIPYAMLPWQFPLHHLPYTIFPSSIVPPTHPPTHYYRYWRINPYHHPRPYLPIHHNICPLYGVHDANFSTKPKKIPPYTKVYQSYEYQ